MEFQNKIWKLDGTPNQILVKFYAKKVAIKSEICCGKSLESAGFFFFNLKVLNL